MNKKRRSSGKKPAKRGSQRKELEETEHKLHAQIGQLEEFIANSPFREEKREIATRNIISPPERTKKSATKRKKRLNKHMQTAREERHHHLFNFLCLFLLLCAMLYWLFLPVLPM